MDFYLNIMYFLLLAAMLTGFVRQRNMETFMMKMLPYFLLFMIAVQIFAVEYSRPLPHKSNHWIFNLFTPIAFGFYTLLLIESVRGKGFRKIIWVLLTGYFSFSVYNMMFLQGFNIFNNYSYIVGCFMVVCTCLLLFLEIVKADQSIPFLQFPIFWITSGLLISHLGDFLIFGMMNTIIKHYPHFVTLSFEIIKYLNAALYALFIIAFLCNPQKQKHYSL